MQGRDVQKRGDAAGHIKTPCGLRLNFIRV